MSIRKLPAIDMALLNSIQSRAKNLDWELNARASKIWEDSPRQSSADPETISIMDSIGADWMGGGVTAKSIADQLKTIGKRAVTVAINSPGGDFFEGLAIYNLLRDHPRNVTVKVMGVAASAAAVIAMAGDKIQVPRAGFLMIHNVWVLAMGNATDLRAIADGLDPFDTVTADIFATRTGMDQKAIRTMLENETWIGGSEAVDKGFADELLPADETPPAKNELVSGPQAAMREIDKGLAAAGVPRSQRRHLIKQLCGKPSAADDGKPSAAEQPAALSGTARLRLSLSLLELEKPNASR